ncbi:Co-chaperone Hsc20 [Punctularia strigosozonata HHB-11173 SS5]|uniref:Co-chaperone Hsc20 n=1 Tax=Punctularia strigosozonata (strain HHB-11173) TaxID=741275 RepID=UPI0004416A5A|nr:Co-chaperone Hsc20 [Punctularia strigosozonata HHB-11173 SS5]EIN13742.1 Co-chaperone Hsc20 [Punctularia strigosozonata HHB-11173 SS5]
MALLRSFTSWTRVVPRTVLRPSIAPGSRWNSTNSTPKSYGNCPSCRAPLQTRLPVCAKCSYISPAPPTLTHHDIFDIPYEPNPFVVDVGELKHRFRNVQRVVHPDTWSSKGPEKHRLAENLSSHVNDAYKTLVSSTRRAEYILKQNGVEMGEEEQLDDPELIMEVMEAREALEEAENEDQVEKIRRQNRERMIETRHELERLIGEKQWEEAKEATIRLRYLRGIDEAARAWPNPPGSNH